MSMERNPADSERIRKGALWSYASQFYLTASSFVAGIALARLLGPAAFGVFIAVTAFTSLLGLLVQLGLPQAILQSERLDDEEANAAFWSVALASWCVAVLVWFAAEPLGRLFAMAAFAPVMKGMTLILVLTPFAGIVLAMMRRALQFAEVARMHIVAFTIGTALSIIAALAGLGAHSLVLGAVGQMLTMVLGLRRRCQWRPGRPRLAAVRRLLGFGGFATADNALQMATNRIDNLLVGALLGDRLLGLYNRAFSLSRLPSEQFSESLGPLLLGSLARVQGDARASRALYFKALSAIAIAAMPFLALLALLGPQAIAFLYGPDWIGAALPLQIMLLGAVFLMVSSSLRRLVLAQGLAAALLQPNLLALFGTIVVVAAGAPFGLAAIAAGISARELLVADALVRVLSRSRLRLRRRELLLVIAPSLVASGFTILLLGALDLRIHAAVGGNPFLYLAAMSCVGIGLYAACIALLVMLWRTHPTLTHSWSLLLRALPRRPKARGAPVGPVRRESGTQVDA